MKYFFPLISLIGFSSCSTMLEGGSATSYREADNGPNKRKSYVRKRIKSRYAPSSPIQRSLIDAVISPPPKSSDLSSSSREEIHPLSDPGPNISNIGLQFALGREPNVVHLGGSFLYDLTGGITGSLGLSLVNSDRTYAGFDGAIRFYLPEEISPYVGVGAYIGDARQCDDMNREDGWVEETCEKFFLTTMYPEVGIQWRLDEAAQMNVFAREYSQVDQTIRDKSSTVYGFSILFR